MNLELLRRVQAKLRRMHHGGHLDMASFARKTDCGTAYCIGGYALLMAGYKTKTVKDQKYLDWLAPDGRQLSWSDDGPNSIWGSAQKILGLTEEQANRLFIDDLWPDEFNDQWQLNDPKVAADRIQHFIDTRGRE